MAPQHGERQAIIFRTAEPLEADLFNVTLSFFSGQPNSSIAKFTLSATADAKPALAGHWEPVTMIRWSATDAKLERKEGNQLRAVELREGNVGPAGENYNLLARTSFRHTTAFRLEAFPVHRATGDTSPRMAWNVAGDFVPREFRVEAAPGTPQLLAVRADGQTLPTAEALAIPPRTHRLLLAMQLPQRPPTVALVDINLGKMNGIECICRLKLQCPAVLCLILTVRSHVKKIYDKLHAHSRTEAVRKYRAQ